MISMAKHTKIKQTQRKNSKCKEEQKTKVTSVRMSENQHMIIQKKADEHEMTTSSYMVYAATHSNNGMNPELLCKTLDIINTARETIREYAPEKLDEMESKVDEFWSLLS